MNLILFWVAIPAAFLLLALAHAGLAAWGASIRRDRGQATPGLTPLERLQRQNALHLARERERALAELGTDWVLHPQSTFGRERA